jgi:hypothetical protein
MKRGNFASAMRPRNDSGLLKIVVSTRALRVLKRLKSMVARLID